MHGLGYGMGMGYGLGWMWFWPALLLVAAIALAAWAIPRSRRPSDRPDEPEQILRQRLAHGDIDIEEYRARLRELNHS
jgi:uncharacterized membrane protein